MVPRGRDRPGFRALLEWARRVFHVLEYAAAFCALALVLWLPGALIERSLPALRGLGGLVPLARLCLGVAFWIATLFLLAAVGALDRAGLGAVLFAVVAALLWLRRARPPFYRHTKSGEAMVREREDVFRADYGCDTVGVANEGFLTPARLDHLTQDLGISWRLLNPYYGLRGVLRPLKNWIMGRREQARFPVVIGSPSSGEASSR